jgi:hypothetical protein
MVTAFNVIFNNISVLSSKVGVIDERMQFYYFILVTLGVRIMVFNATINNI